MIGVNGEVYVEVGAYGLNDWNDTLKGVFTADAF